MLGQQFGPLVLRNLDSLELHTVAYVGFRAALEQTLDRQVRGRRQLGLVGSRGNLALVDQPHPSGSLPMRWPVSCDFGAPSNAACHRTVVHGAG
jgi:hypothetical protein